MKTCMVLCFHVKKKHARCHVFSQFSSYFSLQVHHSGKGSIVQKYQRLWVAKHVLILMVIGVFFQLEFQNISPDLPIILEGICQLEDIGQGDLCHGRWIKLKSDRCMLVLVMHHRLLKPAIPL